MGYRLSLCQKWGIPQNPPLCNLGCEFCVRKIRRLCDGSECVRQSGECCDVRMCVSVCD